MSNMNKLAPQDDTDISGILSTEQKKFYRSCKHSDKLRRFTYTNWCPICEADSSRRRSKSETLETFDNNVFRKRLRDTIKTPSPKKESSSENNTTYGVGDARNILETSRLLRANLCELPTTYINNCQPQLSPEKMGYSAEAVTKLNGITRLHYLSTSPQIENRSGNDTKFKEAYYHEAYKNLAPTKNFINRISNSNISNSISARLNTPRLEEFPPAPTTPPPPPSSAQHPKSPGKKSALNAETKKRDEPTKRLLPTPRPKKVDAYQLPIRPKTCTPEQMRSDNYNIFKNEIFKQKDVTKKKSDSIVANDKQPKSCYVIECQANQKNLQSPVEVAREKTPEKITSEKFVKVAAQKSPQKQGVKSPAKLPPTPEKMKKPPETEALQTPQTSQNAQNLQNAQHLQNSQNAQNSHNLQNSQNAQNPQSPQNSQNLQNSQNAQNSQNPQTPQKKAPEEVEQPSRTKTAPTPADPADGKRHRVRPRSDSDNSVGGVPDKQEQTKKAREISPLQPHNKKEFKAKSAVKLASIKNRHKISVTKLRKVRNKIAHSVSSDSNLSGSDFEDTENEDEDESLEETRIETSGSTPTHKINAEVEPTSPYTNWPLRASLFAHVPPYVKFSSHDKELAKMPRNANKHFKWRLSNITPIVVRKTLSNTGFRLVRSEYSRDSNDWTGTWGKHIKSIVFQTLKESQKLNHFPGTFQIGRKDRLWKNLQRLMFKFGMKEFGFIPRTFVLPHDLKLLRQAWEKTGMDKWIIKPPASARGTGIRVIHRWAHLPKKKSLVVQQYISNPYLINGSKFDLRLYVLVTSFNPLRVYLYPEGLARFASTKYSDDLSTLSDRYMHLTNYSINKLSSHYAANEDANACKGHKWTLSKLWEYLGKDGVNTKNLWRSLQQLVIKTMLCGESSITQLYKQHVNSRYNCYELFGVDVLLDERLKPWLLEVNISPSLHSASPLDLHVKGPLVQSLLNLAQFHLSPKMARTPNAPPVLDTNLYTMQLTTHERLKHLHFIEFEKREEYLSDILRDLTGDDVRHLLTAEDELTVIGGFERIFPTQHTHIYFQFMEPRYYNRLFDAWEHRYEKNRTPGIRILQNLCEKKLHLDVPPISVKKSSDEESTTVSTTSEVTSSSEDVSKPQTPPPPVPRPQTSPIPVLVDPTIKALRNEIRYKLMNLSLGMGLSPF